MSQDLARNLALAMGVVFVVVLLVSLPRMIRIRRALGLPKFNWWVFLLSIALTLVFRLVDRLAG